MKHIVFIILIYLIPLTILVGVGIGVFFISRGILRKLVVRVSTRKLLTWLATVLLTPIVFAGLTWVAIFIWTYYPNRDFTKKDWQANQYKRYEYSASIIKNRKLIGKSKKQVEQLLGGEENTNESDNWKYDLGDKPDFLAIGGGEYTLFVHFEKGTVFKVDDGYDDGGLD